MFQILLLLSPAAICAQRYRKSTNPNDEPFLPIHPDYPYNPKLLKRGLEQQQQQSAQPQTLAQLTPELYAPKVDGHDSYSASYSQNAYSYPSYDGYSKSATALASLASSPYHQSSLAAYSGTPYGPLNSYGAPYGPSSLSSPSLSGYGASASGYGASGTPGFGTSGAPGFGASPYGAPGGYPYYYHQPPYYYPNPYNQPPYPPPPPPGYPGGPSKHRDDDEDDDEDDRRREKNKKSGSQKNRLRSSDREAANNPYVDGANYIISSAKDLDGESSTHRTPSQYNQIDQDSDVHPRTVVLPKATYRLVSISGQQPGSDYSSGTTGFIKVQQLEQLMRQALAKLLAQSAAQHANLAHIQQEAGQQPSSKDNSQYVAVPNTIAKTGLSYVVNPTILNRVNPGQYNPSQLIQTNAFVGGNKQPYAQKSSTSVSLQQSPGIYIPPSKTGSEQSSPPEYGDYDSPESAASRSQPTAEPTRNYPYSTYRSTQQTNLEDVNFGNKAKNKN